MTQTKSNPENTSPENKDMWVILHALEVICYAERKRKQRNIDNERENMGLSHKPKRDKKEKRREFRQQTRDTGLYGSHRYPYHDLKNKKKKKERKKTRNKWYLSPGTPFPTDPYKQQQRKLSTSKPLQSTRDSPGAVRHLGQP